MCGHVFLYGTLLPELAPRGIEPLLTRLRSVGPGSVRGVLYDLGSYPGVVLDENSGGLVRGSVFELLRDDPSLLTRIDDYEGFDPSDCERSLFVRKRSAVQLTDRTVLPCWVYTYNRSISGAALVPDGDYVRWRSERNRLF